MFTFFLCLVVLFCSVKCSSVGVGVQCSVSTLYSVLCCRLTHRASYDWC